MTLLVILLAVLALIVLISGGKTNAFLLVTVPAGLALGKWKPPCRKGWATR